MDNLSLRQLRYFAALARETHFGRAAAACNISQPALSVQIKDLEAELGQQLFERAHREVRLTPFAEALLPRVQDILRAVGELGDMARASGAGRIARLRLGIIPTIAPYMLPGLVHALGQSQPGIDLQVRETMTETLLAALSAGQLDAALLALPVSEPALEEVELFTEPFVLVRPEAEAGTPVPSAQDLSAMRLLLLEEGHCFRDQALSFCDLPTMRPRAGFDGSSLTTLVQMVAAGMGVTLLPAMAVETECRGTTLDTAHFPAPGPERRVGLVWRRSSPLAAGLRAVTEELRAGAFGAAAR